MMRENNIYFKQNKFIHLLVIFLLLFSAKISFAWPLFKKELDNYLLHYKGVHDQYIKTVLTPNGCFIPADEEKIKKQWFILKEQVRQEIGSVEPQPDRKTLFWQNSANTIEDIHKVANDFIPDFKEIIESTVLSVPSSFHTGYKYILKTKSSIQNKVNRDTADGIKEPIKWIGDVLRATIVVDTPAQFRSVVQNLAKISQQKGHAIAYKNIYEQNYKSGYVGVHAILKLSKNKEAVLGEIQIHFKDIYDGTEQCPKKYAHDIYDITRDLKPDNNKVSQATNNLITKLDDNGNLAQKLVYAFGLNRIISRNAITRKALDVNQKFISSKNGTVNDERNYYFARGFLLKTLLDEHKIIKEIQIFNPKSNAWDGPYYSGSKDYTTYLIWIQNEDKSRDSKRKDDSLKINKIVAEEVKQILLDKNRIESRNLFSKIRNIFSGWFSQLCSCKNKCMRTCNLV